jgi:hypothetical protein
MYISKLNNASLPKDCWLKKICAFPTDKKKKMAFYWNIFLFVLSLSQAMLTDIFLVEFLRPLQKIYNKVCQCSAYLHRTRKIEKS